MYLGDYLKGDVVRVPMNTAEADGDSANPSAYGTVAVYEEDSVAEITAGLTAVNAHDGHAGTHVIAVDTANAAYLAGKTYSVKRHTMTIDGKAVSVFLAQFSIQRRHSLKPVVGVAQGGAAGYVDLPTAASSSDGAYDGAMVVITGGTGAGQARYRGTTYTGATRRFTVDPNFDTAPDNTSIVEVLITAPAPETDVPTSRLKVGTGTGEVNVSGGKVPATVAAGDLAANSLTASAAAADFIAEVQSGLALASNLATVAGYLDTEIGTLLSNVAGILAAVDTEVAAIKAKTDTIPGSPAAVGSAMALDSGTLTELTIAVVRALNGADGFGVEKDVENNQIVLTIPGVGTVTIPAVFASSSPAITKVGA